MTDRNDRGADRAETARRTDDSALIDSAQGAPAQGDRSGHNIAHDLASRDELKQEIGEPGVTRIRGGDKPEQANLPRYNPGNEKLNP